MPRIPGWRKIYEGKATLGHSVGNPLVLLWENEATDDEVSIKRYYQWTANKNIRYPDDDEIPDHKGKWILVTVDGESYFDTRDDATEAAYEYMREQTQSHKSLVV